MQGRRWTMDEMRELLAEQEASGLSLKAFAEALEVPYGTLTWWRSRLRRAESARLVPVVTLFDDDAVEVPGVEILVGDVTVRVPVGTSAETTARLVRAIASC